jgi:hypothetical protein
MFPACRLTALALVLAGTAALAACGGGSSDDGARQLLRDTFRNATTVRSGRVDVRLTVKTDGLPGLRRPIRVTFGGPFDRSAGASAPRFDFALGLSAGGRPLTAGATSTGHRVFFSLQGADYELPAAQAKAFRDSFSQVQGIAQSKPTSTGDVPWLTAPRVEGSGDAAGTPTTRISADVDVRRLLDGLTRRPSGRSALSVAQRDQVVRAIERPRFVIDTGKRDKVLRRVRVAFRLVVPLDSRAQAGGLRAADVALDYAIVDLNQPQTITAPAHTRPASELATRLRALTSLVQGAFGGLGSSAPSARPGAAPAERYNRCVRDAGNDVAKAQQCASLLN